MHETKSATRWPLNFTHANMILRGTTPEGIEVEMSVGRIQFKDPGDVAIIEVHDNDPVVVNIDRRERPGPPQHFMIDLRGTMVLEGPDDALYSVSVQQPEDIERVVVNEPTQDTLFPSGWSDPKDWA